MPTYTVIYWLPHSEKPVVYVGCTKSAGPIAAVKDGVILIRFAKEDGTNIEVAGAEWVSVEEEHSLRSVRQEPTTKDLYKNNFVSSEQSG